MYESTPVRVYVLNMKPRKRGLLLAVVALVLLGIFIGRHRLRSVTKSAICLARTSFSSDRIVPPPVITADEELLAHDESAPKAFMFPLRIPEQVTMSTIHFHQFLNLVHDWNFTGVEPFMYNSFMFGLRSLHSDDPGGSMPFNKLFDSHKQNEQLSSCMGKATTDALTGRPALLFEPITEFLRRSHRRFVIVYFTSHVQALTTIPCHIQVPLKFAVENEPSNAQFMDCTDAAKTHGLFRYVESLLNKEVGIERQYPSSNKSLGLSDNLSVFKGVQAFCVKKGNEISLHDLRDYVFQHLQHGYGDSKGTHNAVSIIFISWQGRFTLPLTEVDVRYYINKCRMSFSQPFHSNYVLEMAKHYVNSLGFQGKPYLSIHVRFEKLYVHAKKQGKSIDAYMDCCVSRLNSVISLLTQKFNISKENVLLNWDYSPYGTIVCPLWTGCIYNTNKYLHRIAAKASYFEPHEFGAPTNRGFISLVEMNALFGGEALVTVGEGSYQFTIGETFVNQGANRLHYANLCMPQEKLHELSGVLYTNC